MHQFAKIKNTSRSSFSFQGWQPNLGRPGPHQPHWPSSPPWRLSGHLEHSLSSSVKHLRCSPTELPYIVVRGDRRGKPARLPSIIPCDRHFPPRQRQSSVSCSLSVGKGSGQKPPSSVADRFCFVKCGRGLMLLFLLQIKVSVFQFCSVKAVWSVLIKARVVSWWERVKSLLRACSGPNPDSVTCFSNRLFCF